LFNDIQIKKLASSRTIKVNNMQPERSQRLPPESYIQGAVRKYRFAVIITLIKANTFTVSKVYGRNYFYVPLPHILELTLGY